MPLFKLNPSEVANRRALVVLNTLIDEGKSSRRFDTVSSLVADRTFGYTSGEKVEVGQRFSTSEGYTYEVISSESSDQHLTTSGGVKLKVIYLHLPAFPFEALKPAKDGVTDDLEKLNKAISTVISDGGEVVDLGSGDIYLSADPTNYKFVYLIGHNLTISGNTTSDFSVHENTYSYNTTAAAEGSTGGAGGNRSWTKKYSGSPCAIIVERTDVAGQPVVWGRFQTSHDGFIVSADSRKSIIFGVNDSQTDEGCFTGLTISKSSVLFNAERRDVDTIFYTQADTQSLFIDGASGEVRVRNSAVSTLSVQSTGVDSRARVWLQNDARAWSVQIHTSDTFRINDESGNGNVFLLNTGLAASALTMEAPGTLHLQGFPTSKLKLVDAGIVGATNDAWIQIAVGGTTYYLRAFLTK